jgi:hypothetical protein
MDVGLRALSLLIVAFALEGGSRDGACSSVPPPADGASSGSGPLSVPRLALEVQNAMDACFVDPEYCGNLSNNHHLTAVACLLLLLASTEPLGSPARAATRRHQSMWNIARRWLMRALATQFDADGAHFEYSSGYHMCTLELLNLASLATLEMQRTSTCGTADAAADRWSRLEEASPALGRTLKGALGFAESLLRPDRTYPLIGDFDASRILRTHVRYLPPARCAETGSAAMFRVERYRLGVVGNLSDHELLATVTECTNGDAACRMTRALFAVPDPLPAHLIPPGARRGRGPGVFKCSAARATAPVRRRPVQPEIGVTTVVGPLELAVIRDALGDRASKLRSCVSYRIPLPLVDRFLNIRLFRQAGLLVAQGACFMVTLRSGLPGQGGLGTHSHLDHLASDVWVANGARISDPGSWCYGESAELRNRYRATGAHFSPLWQADWSQSLRHPFFLHHPPTAAIISLGASALRGVMDIDGGWVGRFISLRGNSLIVVDASSVMALTPYPLHSPLPVADGYFGPLVRMQSHKEPMTCAA